MRTRTGLVALLLLILVTGLLNQEAHAKAPTVKAVLFFSPTCPHCQKVMQEDLPPIKARFKDQLMIAEIDVTQSEGQTLFQSALAQFQVPDDRIGVPTLIIGDQVLVGSKEIPEKSVGLIEAGLLKGGVDWPEIPGLANLIPQTTPDPRPVFLIKFLRDPLANSIAVIVLIGMIASLIGVSIHFIRDTDKKLFHWPRWSIPILAIIGLGVAFYLAFVEVTKTQAFCGPVGKCGDVQFSPYAYLFGVIPVGIMGMAGYIAILVIWLVQRFGPQSLRSISALAIWGMAWFGILFSIYLTFLEPFVIGATCMWCISSAIVMTLVFLASTGPAKEAWKIDQEPLTDDSTDDPDAESL